MKTKEERQQQKELKKQIKRASKPGKLATRDAWCGVAFITPWLIGTALLLLYPLINSMYFSTQIIRFNPMKGTTYTPNGFQNFSEVLLTDPDFPVQLLSYVTSTIISVPIIVVFALIIAIMLNQNIKGKGIFRTLFFLPVIIVSGPILVLLTEQGAASISTIDTVAINAAISGVLPGGLGGLAEGISSIFGNLVTILWYAGVPILIFLSALQKINPAMYEAAKIDGGSGWECFWKVTLPNIKSMILLNCVYVIIFISGNDSNAIIGLIEENMLSGDPKKGYGYASAMAWMYTIVVLLIVGLFALIFMAKKDVYEKQVKKAKKAMKKEERLRKKIERRSARNARKIQKARTKKGYKTYDGSGDY